MAQKNETVPMYSVSGVAFSYSFFSLWLLNFFILSAMLIWRRKFQPVKARGCCFMFFWLFIYTILCFNNVLYIAIGM